MGMHITSVFNLNTGATAVAKERNKNYLHCQSIECYLPPEHTRMYLECRILVIIKEMKWCDHIRNLPDILQAWHGQTPRSPEAKTLVIAGPDTKIEMFWLITIVDLDLVLKTLFVSAMHGTNCHGRVH